MMPVRRRIDRAGPGNEAGFTMIEMLIACFISIVFLMVIGSAYLVNQKSYSRNDEKRLLQQTASHVMEIMERRIRSAARAAIAASDRIQLFDSSGAEITRFRLATSGSTTKLFEQSAVLAQQNLISLSFVPNGDTTVVRVSLTLEDKNKNRVALIASASPRNSIKARNLKP